MVKVMCTLFDSFYPRYVRFANSDKQELQKCGGGGNHSYFSIICDICRSSPAEESSFDAELRRVP